MVLSILKLSLLILCYKVTLTNCLFIAWYRPMTDHSSPEKSPWGWKALIIAVILSSFFMGFFYLAVTNEPDYMPSQQNKETHQHAFKNSPVMSEEALAEAEQQKKEHEQASQHAHGTAADYKMTEEEHVAMSDDQAPSESKQHSH